MNDGVSENLRWNFTFNVLDIAFFSFGLGFAGPYTIIPVFVHEHCSSPFSIGIRPLLIGFITALTSVGWYLPQVLTATHVASLKRCKPFVLAAGLAQRLPFLFMGVITALMARSSGDVVLLVFFLLYTVQTFAGGFVATAWQELIATVIPLKRRGIFFGTAFLLGGVLMILGGQLAGVLLEYVPRPDNYALCFGACFLLTMISWTFLAQTREPPRKKRRDRIPLGRYFPQLPGIIRRDRNWRAYMLSQFAIVPAGIICVFVPVWGKFELGVSDYEVGLMTSLAALGETVGNPLFGYLGDRRGHKLCLEIASGALVGALSAVSVLPTRVGLYGALFLIGLYTAGRKVSGTVIAFEFCEPEDRPTYIGLTNTLLGPFFAIGALLGGIMVMHCGYSAAFAGALLLAGAGLAYLSLAVREPRHVRFYSGGQNEKNVR